ncbi:Alpha/Beta hydrolase protein [Armillaria novae-zelandiae]|uniref:Alpha/Beta hydrolase protein n=1 Tax=Armillaria novae-zelandiae TaxID=153914 RepID=A0AA39TSA6_9AGAR|nr:Alpha/Beta hydrolase protein [Armillaria novae-zelandiae]
MIATFIRYREELPVRESLANYTTWTAMASLDANVEELCDGAKLLWVGPKRLDKVVLYCHGGRYMLGIGENALSWLRYIQLELEKHNIDLGIAVVAYNLLLSAIFPSQLREATDGFNHLIKAGVPPENIIISGDSAGGNLALQLLSHILYPLPSVQTAQASPETRLCSLPLISPFVGAKGTLGKPLLQLAAQHKRDFLPADFHHYVCRTLLKDVPESDIAYADSLEAPEEWFKPLGETIGHILITVGEWDFLVDDDKGFYEKCVKPFHRDARFVVEKEGEHVVPILDFVMKEERLSILTPLIVEWLADTFREPVL